MGDVLKGIFVGALIFFTAGLILPAIGLAAPMAGLFSIESALLAATIGGAITGGLAVLLAPSMDLGDVQNRLNLSIDPNAMAKWVFGETPCATDIMFAATHGPDDKYVSHVIAGAAHRVESFENLWINDDAVVIDPVNWDASGDWADGVWQQVRLGFEGQSSFQNIDADDAFSPDLWPVEADGDNIACYRFRWNTEFDKIQNEGGIPGRITQVVKGGRVYDPRLDSSRGGFGPHRPEDQTTWQYNDGSKDIGTNWALVVINYLLGYRKDPGPGGPLTEPGELLWGVGVPPDDIDWDQAIAMANVCDTLVDGIPKYRVSGLFSLSQDHERIIGELEAAILGKIAPVGGRYYIWAPHDDLVPFDRIDEVDLVREVGVEFLPSGPLEQLYNTCRGRFVSPSELYQPVPYAEIREEAFITEDGRVRSVEHDFACIQDSSIAERIARYKIRRSRFGATWRFALGPKGLTFRPFTVTTLNIQETNFEDTLVRVVDMTITQQGVVLMTCIEEDPSIYDTNDPLVGPPGQNDPGPQLPQGEGPRLVNHNVHNTRGDQPDCTSGMSLSNDGYLRLMSPAAALYIPNDPVWTQKGRQWIGTDNINRDFWARATLNSGGPLDTGVLDTWELLNANQSWSIVQSGLGSKVANVTLDIADDVAGTNILATGIFDLLAEIVPTFAANQNGDDPDVTWPEVGVLINDADGDPLTGTTEFMAVRTYFRSAFTDEVFNVGGGLIIPTATPLDYEVQLELVSGDATNVGATLSPSFPITGWMEGDDHPDFGWRVTVLNESKQAVVAVRIRTAGTQDIIFDETIDLFVRYT